jgi:acetoin utilization deacetylase AcuC-like enzyme
VKLVMSGWTDDTGHEERGHPERPDRLSAVIAGVDDLHLGDDLDIVAPYAATRSQLSRVHEGTYLDELGAFCYSGGGDIDQDTYATYDSWKIAQFAAGGGLAVIEELRRRDSGVGFVAARPPGHHALRDRAMGFCLLNNIAVAAAALLSAGERVLIVDWDVHHGNGTQSIFWDEPNVLYVSTHQWPLFPGSGGAREVGGHRAWGQTVNIPVPPGTTGDVLRRAMDDVAAPVIDEFDPTWVLVSAGFDAHMDDPLAELQLSSGDFADLARSVAGFTPTTGRTVLFLEGGYDLAALRGSVSATLGALLDSPYQPEPPTFGTDGAHVVRQVASERHIALDQHHGPTSSEENP